VPVPMEVDIGWAEEIEMASVPEIGFDDAPRH
jgi:hypothetical protein